MTILLANSKMLLYALLGPILLFSYALCEASSSGTSQLPLSRLENQHNIEKSIQQFRSDLENLRNVPTSALTTPCWKISRDSTFTKSWSFDDWDKHQAQSALRYFRHLVSWFVSPTAANIMPTIFLVAIWTVILFKTAEVKTLNMSATKFAMTLGFIQAPILLLLTLKTNRSLDRMLETRKAWGVLCRASRSLTGLISAYVIPYEPELGLIVARYLSLIGWSLKAHFRRNEDETDLISALFQQYPDEKEWLINSPTKRPLAIVTRLRYLFSTLGRESNTGNAKLPPVILLRMDEILYDIEQTIGICTRVFVSPVPPTYTRHTSRVLLLYMFLMVSYFSPREFCYYVCISFTFINKMNEYTQPGALVGSGVALIPAIVTATFASYVLVGIDEIGLESKFTEIDDFADIAREHL